MTDAMLPDKEPIPNSAGRTETAPLEATEDDELGLGERFDPKQRITGIP